MVERVFVGGPWRKDERTLREDGRALEGQRAFCQPLGSEGGAHDAISSLYDIALRTDRIREFGLYGIELRSIRLYN